MSAQRANQLLEAGLWLRLSGDHAGAKRLFEQALRMDPSNAKAQRLIAEGPGDAFTQTELPQEIKAAAPNVPAPLASSAPTLAGPLPPAITVLPVGYVPSPPASGTPTPPRVQPPVPLPAATQTPSPSPPPAQTVPAYSYAPPPATAQPFAPAPPAAAPIPEPAALAPPAPAPAPVTQSYSPPSPAARPPALHPAFSQPPPERVVPERQVITTPIPITRQDIQRLPSDPTSPARAGGTTRIEPPAKELARNATSAWDFKSNPSEQIPPSPVTEVTRGPMDWAVEPPLASGAVPEDSEVRRDEARTLLKGARELMDLDDHTGALELILKADGIAPGDPQVKVMKDRSESTLQAMYESKLGDLSVNPRVRLKDDEIIWLNLDHRAGFVLAQIDGGVSFEDVFAVSGMSRLDTARILAQLLEEGVIGA